jgi:hypothetical protein
VSMDAEHIARAQQALQERGEYKTTDGRSIMKLDEKEAKLIRFIRDLGHGELRVSVRDSLPSYIEKAVENIRL